jgi:pilus assembly protein CpaF
MDHALDDLADRLRERLLAEAGDGGPGGLTGRIDALVDREAGLLDAATRADLAARVARRSFGLGPLEPLLADPDVDEIMVNGTGSVWVERRGRLEATDVRFATEDDLRGAVERILAPLGRRVDESEPMVDARMGDGSRVNVVLPPLAVDGPAMTIRRFRARPLDADELVTRGTWSPPLRDFLARAVRARLNVLVSGGTGSGKTTTLGALSSFVDARERIVTIEDTAELRLQQPHVVRLEGRPPNVEGRGEVTLRKLLKNALRMRPDRIVVGEIRGGEGPRCGVAPRRGAVPTGARGVAVRPGTSAPKSDAPVPTKGSRSRSSPPAPRSSTPATPAGMGGPGTCAARSSAPSSTRLTGCASSRPRCRPTPTRVGVPASNHRRG